METVNKHFNLHPHHLGPCYFNPMVHSALYLIFSDCYSVLTVHVSSVLLLVLVTCLVAARGPGGHPPAARGLMAASSLC